MKVTELTEEIFNENLVAIRDEIQEVLLNTSKIISMMKGNSLVMNLIHLGMIQALVEPESAFGSTFSTAFILGFTMAKRITETENLENMLKENK